MIGRILLYVVLGVALGARALWALRTRQLTRGDKFGHSYVETHDANPPGFRIAIVTMFILSAGSFVLAILVSLGLWPY